MSAEPLMSTEAVTPVILRLSVVAMPLVDAGRAGHGIEGEALREHVAEVQRQPPRQRLQVEHAQELGRARIDLQELARMHIHVALPARLAMSMA
jgi:hypothetical protein